MSPATFTSQDGNLKIEVYGDSMDYLALANNNPKTGDEGLQVTKVAGSPFG